MPGGVGAAALEVLVGFVNGDMDMPLVMGCLPNAATQVPLDLPADKTRSVFRSQSSPGGGGYNELRIEDKKGAEEIYLRAQRNWTQHVLHDQQVQVDNQRSIVVTGTARHELKADEQRITHGHRTGEGQCLAFAVGGNHHLEGAGAADTLAGQFDRVLRRRRLHRGHFGRRRRRWCRRFRRATAGQAGRSNQGQAQQTQLHGSTTHRCKARDYPRPCAVEQISRVSTPSAKIAQQAIATSCRQRFRNRPWPGPDQWRDSDR